MAKRRRRSVGASPVRAGPPVFNGGSWPGREGFASRSPLLLPRALAVAPSSQAKLDGLRAVLARSYLRRRQVPLPVVQQVRRRRAQLLQLHAWAMPSRLRSNPCAKRAVRKEVMFSLKVAGRRWGSGGPRMSQARRTVESSYTCRR